MERKWIELLKNLKKWYHPSHRKLPWKNINDPYLIWVSEVFLQQTQANRVIEFFLRFTARFPTVEDLAKTSFKEALPYFRGLGFYSRLRRMLEAARAIVKEYGGIFPKNVTKLRNLSGIGEYTARAILSFAYKKPGLAPDTNVSRVLSRFFDPQKNQALEKKWVLKHLAFFDQHFPKTLKLNQALMDLGSSLCLAKNPKCQICPLAKSCQFEKNPERFLEDVKIPRKIIPRNYQKVVVGILIRGQKVLVSRRKEAQTFSGLLEFPGGKVEAGEDERRAMQREFQEEVGVQVSVRPPFTKIVQHSRKQVLSFHRCRILIGDPRSLEGQEIFWIQQKDLNARLFLPANKRIIEELKKSRL